MTDRPVKARPAGRLAGLGDGFRRLARGAGRRSDWPIGLFLPIVGLGAAFAPGRSAAVARPPVTVPLAVLRADPFRYTGQSVRVTGRLDECYGRECALCPSAMTNATADHDQCLTISFRPLMKDTAFGADAKEALFRFLTVTVDATVDTGCLRVPCPDRNAILVEADVVDVLQRRPGHLGLWFGERTPLRAIVGAETTALVAAGRRAGFLKAEAEDAAKSEVEQILEKAVGARSWIKAFAVDGRWDLALLCVSGSNAEWPDSLEAGLYIKSIDDRYICHAFRRSGSDWYAQVETARLR